MKCQRESVFSRLVQCWLSYLNLTVLRGVADHCDVCNVKIKLSSGCSDTIKEVNVAANIPGMLSMPDPNPNLC